MSEAEPHHLKVLVADERQKYLEPIADAVRELGHEVIAHETEISEVGQATIERRPDVAIVALHEDTGHALELISQIVEEATCPVMALARDASSEFVAEAANRGVFAHLDSTDKTELQGAIDVALQRYHQYRKLLDGVRTQGAHRAGEGHPHGAPRRGRSRGLRAHPPGRARTRRKVIDVVDELLASQD